MNLAQFISRMLGFADKVETNLTAQQELATAKASIATSEARIKELELSLAAKDSKITELEAKLATAEADGKAKDVTIVQLSGEVETEKDKANKIIASQGIAADQLPPVDTGKAPGASSADIIAQYDAITNPVEKAKFRQKNFNALLKAAKQK